MRYLLAFSIWLFLAVFGTMSVYSTLHPTSEVVMELKELEIRDTEFEEALGTRLVKTELEFGSFEAFMQFTDEQLSDAGDSALLLRSDMQVRRARVLAPDVISGSTATASALRVGYVYWNDELFFVTSSWSVYPNAYVDDGVLYWSVQTGGTPNNLWWVLPGLLLMNCGYLLGLRSLWSICGEAYKTALREELPRPVFHI